MLPSNGCIIQNTTDFTRTLPKFSPWQWCGDPGNVSIGNSLCQQLSSALDVGLFALASLFPFGVGQDSRGSWQKAGVTNIALCFRKMQVGKARPGEISEQYGDAYHHAVFSLSCWTWPCGTSKVGRHWKAGLIHSVSTFQDFHRNALDAEDAPCPALIYTLCTPTWPNTGNKLLVRR